MNSVTVRFDDALELTVQPDPAHEWLLTNEQVAQGYGVKISSIREHKRAHADELVQDKHFIGVRNPDTVGSGGSLMTLWTKRGVVRLGFFIRSERAKKFRDFCENLVLETLALPAPKPTRKPVLRPLVIPPTPLHSALEAMRAASDAYGLLAQSTVAEHPALYSHLAELIALWVTVTNHRLGRNAAPYYDRVCKAFSLERLEDLELDRFEPVVQWLTMAMQQEQV